MEIDNKKEYPKRIISIPRWLLRGLSDAQIQEFFRRWNEIDKQIELEQIAKAKASGRYSKQYFVVSYLCEYNPRKFEAAFYF